MQDLAISALSVALQAGGQGRDLSFLAYLDVWIIGGLVLLVVAVVVGKWLWGKLTRRHDDADEYYYDDDDYYDYDR